MIITQSIAAIEALQPQVGSLHDALLTTPSPSSFSEVLGNAIDTVAGSLDRADALSVAAASKPDQIADAAVARARADIMLEVAAVTAAKVSGAIGQLLQTQL